MNRLLGTIAGMLFPMPYSMFRVTHQGHHLRNRTDYEMFDLYYPTDSRLVRFIQWYGILSGFFWPFVPLGAILFAIMPRVVRAPIFQRARSSSYLIGDVLVPDHRTWARAAHAQGFGEGEGPRVEERWVEDRPGQDHRIRRVHQERDPSPRSPGPKCSETTACGQPPQPARPSPGDLAEAEIAELTSGRRHP